MASAIGDRPRYEWPAGGARRLPGGTRGGRAPLLARSSERYARLDAALADASLVVLADRHGTRDILTLDRRHFRALTGLDGQPFRLLPADA
jgi:hypothetical protein